MHIYNVCIRGSGTLGQSGCGRICVPDPSSSANLDSQIWVAASTSPYFWTNSARVSQHLAPHFRCRVLSDIRRYKLLSFHCPWQLVHSSRRRASFSELRCAALPAARISRGVLEPEAFIRCTRLAWLIWWIHEFKYNQDMIDRSIPRRSKHFFCLDDIPKNGSIISSRNF